MSKYTKTLKKPGKHGHLREWLLKTDQNLSLSSGRKTFRIGDETPPVFMRQDINKQPFLN